MKVLTLLTLAGVLGYSQTKLPMIGNCPYKKFTLDIRSCNTKFIRSMMKNPKSDCSVELNSLIDCSVGTIKPCLPTGTDITVIKTLLQQLITKDLMCEKAGIQFPSTMGLNVTLPCNLTVKAYTTEINSCSNKMLSLWKANRADPKICGAYKLSQDCARNIIHSRCDFNSIDWFKTLMDLTLGDYNPFCTTDPKPGGAPGTSLSGLLVVCALFLSVAAMG